MRVPPIGANADEVDAFLAEQVPVLGFKKEITRVPYKGITYSRIELEQRTADVALASPAYMLVQNHLVLANNEDWFRKIVDTIGGAPSLAADPTFQATMASLPNEAESRDCLFKLAGWIGQLVERRKAEGPRGDVVDAVMEILARTPA